MANNIIFTDGFDNYTTLIDKWDTSALLLTSLNGSAGTSNLIPTIIPGAGRGGAGAVKMFASFSPNGLGTYGVRSLIGKNVGAQASMYVGFAFSFDPTSQTMDTEILRFVDGGTLQVGLWITQAGLLYFTRGAATVIGSPTTTPFPANSFHYIEAFVTIDGAAGVASLRVDQTLLLNQTGLNTKVSANAFMTTVQLGTIIENIVINSGVGQFTPVVFIDDVYFDTLGYNGDNRINGLVPSGDGTTQNFSTVAAAWPANTALAVATTIFDGTNLQRVVSVTGDAKTGPTTAPTWATTVGVNTTDNHVTWTCLGAPAQYKYVNEPNPDGDFSYIKSNTVGDISRFTYPPIPTGASVKSVIIWPNMKKDDGGARTVRGHIKSGGSTGDTGVDVSPGGNYQYQALISATDPATGVGWTASGVNAAEFGIKITS